MRMHMQKRDVRLTEQLCGVFGQRGDRRIAAASRRKRWGAARRVVCCLAAAAAAAALCAARPADCFAAPVIAAFPGGEQDAAGSGAGFDSPLETVSNTVTAMASNTAAVSNAAVVPDRAASFDADRFVLPAEAKVLVVVEGTGGSGCRVYAYEKTGDGWDRRLVTAGYLGLNGMSNHRVSGDKTTPIGVFQMNTPFGQEDALEGFPSNYLKVKESHVWTDDTNVMVDDASAVGEHVGTFWYDEYYDYAIDAGFNRNGLENQGSALFLHCIGQGKDYTSGCVAIPKEQMIAVMRLYGTYGDGACYIAQAPEGTFDQIYNTYGVNQGLSPDGNFG